MEVLHALQQCGKQTQEEGDEAIGMDDEMVEHKLKYSQLQITTDTGLLEGFSRLAEKEQTMSKKDFELWQMACGFTFAKHPLLADQALRRANLPPASQYCHDWMHCTLSNGCLNIAMFGLLEAMPKTIWTSLGSYIQQWVLPATWRMKHLSSLFTEKRLKKYKEAHTQNCCSSLRGLSFGTDFRILCAQHCFAQWVLHW